MSWLKNFIKTFLRFFDLRISRDTPESEVPIDILRKFLVTLEPQQVTNLVRVGSSNDGGYVIPEDLGETCKLFSPGCDGLVDFERDLYSKFQISSIVLDDISKKPKYLEPFIEFQHNWLDATSSEKTISLKDWVSSNSESNQTLILQMDIEGSEYEVLRNTPEYIVNRFHTIVIEFHYFEMIKNSFLFNSKIKPVFDLLLNNHVPIFVNPNNCCGVVRFGNFSFPRVFEITLLRRSEIINRPMNENAIIKPYINVANLPQISINWKDFQSA